MTGIELYERCSFYDTFLFLGILFFSFPKFDTVCDFHLVKKIIARGAATNNGLVRDSPKNGKRARKKMKKKLALIVKVQLRTAEIVSA